MNLNPRQFLLKNDELMLIKAEYPYSLEELGTKLCGISSQERRFIRNINKYVPIHNEITNGCYWEYCLVDQKIFESLTKLVNKHEIDCKLTDVSKQFIDNSIHIDNDFKEKVIEYIHCVMELDTILDRLNLIGINQLNDFEMFYLERASQGFVKI